MHKARPSQLLPFSKDTNGTHEALSGFGRRRRRRNYCNVFLQNQLIVF